MTLVSQFEVGQGKDQIQYQSSVNAGSSPNELTFFNGHSIWIGEVDDAKLFDINRKTFIETVPYPNDVEGNIGNGSYALFYSTKLILNSAYMVGYDVLRTPAKISPPTYYRQVMASSRPYAIRDHVFFYGKDGFAYSIDLKGNLKTKDTTKNLLLEWQKTTWYSNEAERSVIADLLSTGKYIIVDAVFYPNNSRQLFEYFSKRGFSSNRLAFLNAGFSIPKGMSLTGDIYFGAGAEGIDVVNQQGEILSSINILSVSLAESDSRFTPDKPEFYDLSPTLYTVNPNGDLYALYAIKDEVARLYKATKSWGTDYVGMAKTGLIAGTEASIREQLQAMSSTELRITRNALFALYGYNFKSKDILDYFLGYDWYAPDPKVKSDTAILTADQKRLFDMIIAIEKERVVAP